MGRNRVTLLYSYCGFLDSPITSQSPRSPAERNNHESKSVTRLNNWFIWCPIGRNYNNRSVPWLLGRATTIESPVSERLVRRCGTLRLRRSVSVKGVESSSSLTLPSVARWKRSPSRTQRERGATERVRYNYVDSKRTPLISWKIKVSVYVPTSIERKFTMKYRVLLDTFWIDTSITKLLSLWNS